MGGNYAAAVWCLECARLRSQKGWLQLSATNLVPLMTRCYRAICWENREVFFTADVASDVRLQGEKCCTRVINVWVTAATELQTRTAHPNSSRVLVPAECSATTNRKSSGQYTLYFILYFMLAISKGGKKNSFFHKRHQKTITTITARVDQQKHCKLANNLWDILLCMTPQLTLHCCCFKGTNLVEKGILA